MVDDTNGQIVHFTSYTSYYAHHETLFETVEFIFVSPFLPFTTFIVVSMATAVTVVRLRLASAWRASTSHAGGSGEEGGGRVNRLIQQQAAVTKVLVLISCLYILCSAPAVAVAATRFVVPGERFYPWGRYSNMFFAVQDASYTLAAVNSSLNFFIYVWRSSRYRRTLSTWLVCVKRRQPAKGPSELATRRSFASRRT